MVYHIPNCRHIQISYQEILYFLICIRTKGGRPVFSDMTEIQKTLIKDVIGTIICFYAGEFGTLNNIF